MASASAGLELPATSLIAPLLGRIAVSWRESPLPRALITRRRQGWQYDGQPGPGFIPVDSGSLGLRGLALTPSPAWGEGVDRACCALPCERDGVDVPPVVGLVAVGGAAVAEEPCRIGIGAVPEVLDPADAGRGEAGGDVAGQIEQGVLRPCRGAEEPFVRAVLGLDAGDEFGRALVVRVAAGRLERDRDVRELGSAPLPGGDGVLEDAGGGAVLAGM